MTESDRQRWNDQVPISREVAQSFFLMGLVAGVSSGLVLLGLLAARLLG
jgi:hypothetical protein